MYYLLSVVRNVGVELHIKLNVLKRSCLRHLPMDPTNVRVRIRQPDVYLEVANAAEEIGRVEVPSLVLRHIRRAGDYTQAYKARGREDGRDIVGL